MSAAAGCSGGGDDPPTPTSPSGTISATARTYLTEVVAVMQEHSINRFKIDWNVFRDTVLASAGAAQTTAETFPAIKQALTLLGDGRALYTPVGGMPVSAERACSVRTVRTPEVPATIGYVRVDAFNGSALDSRIYANQLQAAIAARDRGDLIGWIVDLRGNGGGNMWPMLAGVGPVLGEGRVGYFIDPGGIVNAWEYHDAASWLGSLIQQSVDTPYRLRRESPNVAVLIDNSTSGSGEAIAIAFRQRANARTFGAATCGRSTAGQGFPMSDGATLVISTAVMADRTRLLYGDAVIPDEAAATPEDAEQRAVAWLQSARP